MCGRYVASIADSFAEAFAVGVAKAIKKRTIRRRLFEFLAIPQHVEFFRLQGEQMLYEKALQGIVTSYALLFVQVIADIIVDHTGPLIKATRKSVLARLCRAVMAVEPSSLREFWVHDRGLNDDHVFASWITVDSVGCLRYRSQKHTWSNFGVRITSGPHHRISRSATTVSKHSHVSTFKSLCPLEQGHVSS